MDIFSEKMTHFVCYFPEDKTFAIRHVSQSNLCLKNIELSHCHSIEVIAQYDGCDHRAIIVQVRSIEYTKYF